MRKDKEATLALPEAWEARFSIRSMYGKGTFYNSCNPMNYSLSGSSVHGIFQARILVYVAIFFARGSSQPKDQTQVSWIAGRFFTIWATREAQEYGVGNLSLLQGIFLTQESNQGLLHCRWILYKLSHQGHLDHREAGKKEEWDLIQLGQRKARWVHQKQGAQGKATGSSERTSD